MARAHLADSDYSVMSDFASGTFANVKAKINEHDAALDALEIKQVANAAVPAGVDTYNFNVGDVASADHDIVLPAACKVIEVVCVKNAAGAGNTTQIKRVVAGAPTALTDVMATAVDKTITRAGTMDPAQQTFAAGDTLRCSVVKNAGSGAVDVQVFVVPV